MNCIKRQKDVTLKDEPLRLEGVQYASGEEQSTQNLPNSRAAILNF